MIPKVQKMRCVCISIQRLTCVRRMNALLCPVRDIYVWTYLLDMIFEQY